MKISFTTITTIVSLSVVACTDHLISQPPQPSESCHVVQITLKTLAPILPFSENLEYGDSTYRLGTNDVLKFQYDQQGRINQATKEYTVTPNSNYKSTYEYLPDQILTTRQYPSSSSSNSSGNLIFNSQGYISGGNGTTYSYDSNGYLINRKILNATVAYTIKDKNLVSTEENDYSPINGTRQVLSYYDYDFTKPNFPAAYESPYYLVSTGDQSLVPYLGKPSQNLLIKTTSYATATNKDGKVFKTVTVGQYTYFYNERGSIKRILSVYTNQLLPNGRTSTNIEVYDYDYECLK